MPQNSYDVHTMACKKSNSEISHAPASILMVISDLIHVKFRLVRFALYYLSDLKRPPNTFNPTSDCRGGVYA